MKDGGPAPGQSLDSGETALAGLNCCLLVPVAGDILPPECHLFGRNADAERLADFPAACPPEQGVGNRRVQHGLMGEAASDEGDGSQHR